MNSSVNFIIYCIFGEKFKRIFLRSMFELLGREDYSLPGDIIRYPNNSSAASQPGTTSSLHRNQSILLLHRGIGADQSGAGNAILLPRGGGGNRPRTGFDRVGGASPLYVHSCSELARRESTDYVLCALHSCTNLPGSCLRDKVFLLRASGKNSSKADDNYN